MISVFEGFKGKDFRDRKTERLYWISIFNFTLWLKENELPEQSAIWTKRLLREF